MSLATLLIVILLVVLIAGGVNSRDNLGAVAWPGGILGLILVILLILVLLGRI